MGAAARRRVGSSQHTWLMLCSLPLPCPGGPAPGEGRNWGLILPGNAVLRSWVLPHLR